jgi:hypothetical protein
MASKKGKKTKNNPVNKQPEHKNKLVTSDICEQCNEKCINGTKYIQYIKSGKSGKGTICKK